MTAAAFYGVTDGLKGESATEEEIISYAVNLRESPSETFHEEFREYVAQVERNPKGPLVHDDNGELVDTYAES